MFGSGLDLAALVTWLLLAAVVALIVVVVRSTQPGGLRAFGWISVLGSGLLAFLSASMATSPILLALFVCCGSVLVISAIVTAGRWITGARRIRKQAQGDGMAQETASPKTMI
jgi:hypothetical protein